MNPCTRRAVLVLSLVIPLSVAMSCGGAIQPLPADSPLAAPAPSEVPQESPGDPGPTEPGRESPGNSGPGHTPCSQEIGLVCGSGLVDGCSIQATSWHVCVQATANASSLPCTAEVALQCDPALIDGCLTSPPTSSRHICVSR